MVQLPHYGLHDVWQASMGYFWQARWPCARARSKLDPRANKGRFQEAALAVENPLGPTPVSPTRSPLPKIHKQYKSAAGQRLIQA